MRFNAMQTDRRWNVKTVGAYNIPLKRTTDQGGIPGEIRLYWSMDGETPTHLEVHLNYSEAENLYNELGRLLSELKS